MKALDRRRFLSTMSGAGALVRGGPGVGSVLAQAAVDHSSRTLA